LPPLAGADEAVSSTRGSLLHFALVDAPSVQPVSALTARFILVGSPPLIVVQGANDNAAPIADSRTLVANLKTAGADVTMHEVASAGRGFASPATAWPDAEKAMFDWLTSKGIGK
jgi:acetyl esterase/lipase